MNATFKQVTPEVAQALVTQATSQGLSVNDYLRGLLGMSNGKVAAELAVADTPPRNEKMYQIMLETEELLKDRPLREATAEMLPIALSEAPQAQTAEHPPRNEEMLAIIRRGRERLKDMPVRGSTEETLLMIRKARAGEMWGYEPTDYE